MEKIVKKIQRIIFTTFLAVLVAASLKPVKAEAAHTCKWVKTTKIKATAFNEGVQYWKCSVRGCGKTTKTVIHYPHLVNGKYYCANCSYNNPTYMFTGDSRTVDMYRFVKRMPNFITSVNKKNCLAQYNAGYEWISKNKKKLTATKIIWQFGTNDYAWKFDQYKELLTELQKDHIIFVVSVNPGVTSSEFSNKGALQFNLKMKSLCSQYRNLIYIDSFTTYYSQFMKAAKQNDGLHYTEKIYRNFFKILCQCAGLA